MIQRFVKKLPGVLQTEVQEQFYSATFDQLFNTANVEQAQGFIGRRSSLIFNPDVDNYLISFSISLMPLMPLLKTLVSTFKKIYLTILSTVVAIHLTMIDYSLIYTIHSLHLLTMISSLTIKTIYGLMMVDLSCSYSMMVVLSLIQ